MTRSRAWLVLGLGLAVSALGACSDDGSDATRPSVSVTTSTTITSTTDADRPTLTSEGPSTSDAPTTTEAPTTTAEVTTTTAEVTTTTAEVTTTTADARTTTTEAPPTTAEVTTTELAAPPIDDDNESEWVWLVVVALAIGGVVALVLLASRRRRRREADAAWETEARRVVDDTKLVVEQVRTGVGDRAEGEPAWQHQLLALDARLSSLQQTAGSPIRKQATDDSRRAVGDLGGALESDVRLRIGPPAPTPGQLDTSEAVVVQLARDLDGSLDRLTLATVDST